jgi:hypothetical protein
VALNDNVELEIRAKAILGDAQKQIQQFFREVETHAKGAEKEAGLFSKAISTAAGTLAGFVSAQAIMRGVSAAFTFAKEAVFGMNATLETSTLQFTTLMGDADKARAHVRDLFEFAKKTPFETGPIIQASRMLRTFGGEALDTKDNLTLLGNASAATGAPINDLGFWVGRLYAMLQAGKPFGEAAMRLSELAVLSPQTRQEMERLQTSGAGAAQVFRVFQKDLERFGGAMEAQASTWEGVTSTFSDTINILLADTFRPFFEIVRDGFGMMNEALGSKAVAGALDNFKLSIQGAFGADSQANVKALATGLIGLGQTGLTVSHTLYIVFNLFKTVVTSVTSLLLETITALSEAGFAAFKFTASLDPTGALDTFVQKGEVNIAMMRAFTNSFWDARKAAGAAVDGTDAFAAVVGGMRNTLDAAVGSLSTMRVGQKAVETQTRATTTALTGLNAAGEKLTTEFGKSFNKLSADVGMGLKTLTDSEFLKEFGTKLADAERDMKKFGVTGAKVPPPIAEALERLTKIKFGEHIKKEAEQIQDLPLMLKGVGADLMKIEESITAAVGGRIGRDAANAEGIRRMQMDRLAMDQAAAASTFSKLLSGGLKDSFLNMPATILQAVQGGGNIGGAIGASLGGAVSGALVKGITSKVASGAIAKGLGTVLTSAIPIVGPLLGDLGGKLVGKLFGGLFGGGESKKVEEMRGKFIEAAGGIDVLRAQADAAGVSLDRMLSAKKVKDFEAAQLAVVNAVDAHNKRLQDQAMLTEALAAKQNLVNQAVERYGFKIEELGPTFQRQRLSEQAERLIDDYGLLVEAGINVDTVILRMSDSINEFVRRAIRTGTEVPAAMKPMLEKMVEQGLLTDENGEKITDLTKAGVTFGETLTAGFKSVVAKLDELIAKLTEAAKPRTGRVDIEINENVRRRVTEERGGVGPGDEATVRGAANGGLFSRPTFRVIAEREPEVAGSPNAIVRAFTEALQSTNFVGQAGPDPAIVARLSAISSQFASMQGEMIGLPLAIQRSVRDGVLLAQV